MRNKWSIKKLFFNSIKRGTGEAYLLICKYPQIDFSTEIIKACLNNFVLDGQSESSRGFYLFEIIQKSNQKEKIKSAIIKGLEIEEEETWNLTQLFDLAKHFAIKGDKDTKAIIYHKYLNHPLRDSDWLGEDQILEINGIDGLKFIADKKGKYLKENPDEWQDDWLIKNFQEENPKIDVWGELKKESKYNLNIHNFLKEINRNQENSNNHVRPAYNFINIIAEVLNTHPFVWVNRKFTNTELKLIANRLKIERNSKNIEKLLSVFRRNKYPHNCSLILQLAQKKSNSKNRISEFAIESMQHLRSDRIRNFILAKLKSTSRPEFYLIALRSNFKEEDNVLLKRIAEKTQNIHRIDDIADSYVKIYKSNPTKECKEPLEVIYNKITCGIHRNAIIKILKENGVLSEKINNEIKHDSFAETRELYEFRENGS